MAFKSAVLVALVLALTDAHCLYSNKPVLNACVRRCRASPTAGCVSGCVAGAPYFVRPSCAACLGNGVVCAYRSCRTQCSAGISSNRCTRCITGNCGTCGGAYKEASVNETEYAEALAAVSLELELEEAEEPAADKAAAKAEQKEEAPSAVEPKTAEAEETKKEEVEVEEAAPKAGGCWEDQASLKFCGSQCFSKPNKARCATSCLRNQRGMSAGCASCFGDKVACTIRSCLSECMASSTGPRCKSCVRSKCGRCAFSSAKSLEAPEATDEAAIALATSADSKPEAEKEETPIFP